MISSTVAAATTVVRGFQPTNSTNTGNDDTASDYGSATPRLVASDKTPPAAAATPVLRGRRSRNPVIDDMVSANCSPVQRPATSPAVSGIALLRSQQIESLNLNNSTATSRASSVAPSTSSVSPRVRSHRAAAKRALNGGMSRPQSSHGSDGSGDEGASDISTRYEIDLKDDFVSESAPTLGPLLGDEIFGGDMEGIPENPPRKMTTEDFEPLRCLGKGSYGTVVSVCVCFHKHLFPSAQTNTLLDPREAAVHREALRPEAV